MNRYDCRQFGSLIWIALCLGFCGCGTVDRSSDDPWSNDQLLKEIPDERFDAGRFQEY